MSIRLGVGAADRLGPDPDTIADCVHCGFCLPSCPTYALWGEEMDSPRGRIQLMDRLVKGAEVDASTVDHFDRCLGCMACVTSCPSGVRYDELISDTRARVEHTHHRSLTERATREAIFALFPYRERLRAIRPALRLYQRAGGDRLLSRLHLKDHLPQPLKTMAAVMPPAGPEHAIAERTPAVGSKRGTVAVLTGCVQQAFFSQVNLATVEVLAAEGFEVLAPEQGCCGALSGHSGRDDEARGFARQTIELFSDLGIDALVVNSAGCGSAIKEYGRLFAHRAPVDDHPGSTGPSGRERDSSRAGVQPGSLAGRAAALAAKTYDIAEFLAAHEPVATRHPLPLTVAYHDACHLAHAQGVRAAPRRLLEGIPGVEVAEIAEGDMCCGSAGVYNLLQPEAAAELGRRKAANVEATGADLLVAANPGCILQISAALRRRPAPGNTAPSGAAPGNTAPSGAQGATMPVAHTIEVLAASISGRDPGYFSGSGR